MTAKEVSEYLGIHIETVYKYYRELGGIKLGRIYRFSKDRLFSGAVGGLPVSGESLPVSESSSSRILDDHHDLLA